MSEMSMNLWGNAPTCRRGWMIPLGCMEMGLPRIRSLRWQKRGRIGRGRQCGTGSFKCWPAEGRKKVSKLRQTDSLLYHLLTQSYTCTQGYEIPEIRVVLAFLTELTLDERFFCKCESGCALSYASLLVVMDFNLIEEVMKHDGDEWCSNSFLLCVVPFVWLEHVPT